MYACLHALGGFSIPVQLHLSVCEAGDIRMLTSRCLGHGIQFYSEL